MEKILNLKIEREKMKLSKREGEIIFLMAEYFLEGVKTENTDSKIIKKILKKFEKIGSHEENFMVLIEK